jgi:hypothetical protein
MSDRFFAIEETAAVGKGVGRDVDHAHDEGPLERELELPQG